VSLAALALLVTPPMARGQDESMDDILGGFGDSDDFGGASQEIAEDEEAFVEEVAEEEALGRIWHLQGDVSLGLTASLYDHDSPTEIDYSGLQRFRTKLALQLDVDLPRDWKFRTSGYGFYDFAYVMNGRDGYKKNSSDVLDTYEYDFELTDTYLEGSLDKNVDLKIGRQIVNWGRSETIRVLDIINPLDSREPGLVDIEDIRRPLGMAKLGIFVEQWTITLLAIPEVRAGVFPAYGSDFSPDPTDDIPSDPQEQLDLLLSLSPEKQQTLLALRKMADDLTDIETKLGRDFGKSSQFAINLTGVFSGWDVSLQAARHNADRPYFDIDDGRLEHSRIWMVGTGANYTEGSWLFKAEFAYVDGLKHLWADDKKSRIDSMFGVEYYGLNDVNIVFEIAQRHINDFEKSMELFLDFAQEDTLESALRVSVDLLNDQIHLTVLGFAIGEKAQDGSFVRLSGTYDVMDALSVDAGFVLFQEGDTLFFSDVGRNDRFFAGAKYSF
jgi:hypothetical protein